MVPITFCPNQKVIRTSVDGPKRGHCFENQDPRFLHLCFLYAGHYCTFSSKFKFIVILRRGVKKGNFWRGDNPNCPTKKTSLNQICRQKRLPLIPKSTSTNGVLQICRQAKSLGVWHPPNHPALAMHLILPCP